MAEHISNHPDPSAHLDKENQSNSVELNQTNRTSILTPLQVSGQLDSGRTKDLNWLIAMGKKSAEKKKEKAQNVEKTPRRKKPSAAARGAKAAGKDYELGHLPDKENQINSPVQNQTKRSSTSRMTPLKESQYYNRATNTDLEKRKSTKESTNMEPIVGVQEESSQSVCLKFKWIGRKTDGFITIKVNPHETIVKGLKRSEYFMKKYQSSQNLSVYGRNLHAMINPCAPCGGLEEDEELELCQYNAPNIPETPVYRSGIGGLFIKVNKKGNTEGGAVRVILHSNESSRDNIPMAVFGYGEETIEDALHNDKRFININVLSLKGTQSKYESKVLLSQLPNDDMYTLIVVNEAKPAENINSPVSTKPTCDPSAELPPVQSDACRKMQNTFVDQFNEFVKTQKGLKKAWEVIKRDFSYNILQKRPMTAHMIQILGEYSNHVALLLVKDNDRVTGTGTFFLLTESLGLTCFHVVNDVLKSPDYRIEITFNYNEATAELDYLPAEIVSYSEINDYAFLRVKISPIPGGPQGLIQSLAPPPQQGTSAIIAHPQAQCKQIDICSVVNFYDREKTICNHPSYVHLLGMFHFTEMLDSKLLTYKTCLYEGASGAPVFSERGELVAMHAGGYKVKSPHRDESLIEYGRSAIEIIVMGAIEIEDLHCELLKLIQGNEALQSYMSSSHAPHMQSIIASFENLS
ncbi:serine protease FAM111A-like [Dendrobates tinctorius]|uniref:serine protease FAM111A-like n=1 Tax=Dendrobates tinctorius TaxID=92724 RepID=UPI003CC94C0C